MAVDEHARDLAKSAQATATSAWEGVGTVLREGHELRAEMHDGFLELKRLFMHAIDHFGRVTGHEVPSLPPAAPEKPPSGRRAYENGEGPGHHVDHEYGRRDYDPEHTSPGSTNLSVDEAVWKSTQARLRRLEQKDAEDQAEKDRLATAARLLQAEKDGADKLVRKYKRWLKIASALGVPSAIGWAIEHWHLFRP